MWVHDGVTKELDINAAMNEHKFLAEVLRLDIDPPTLIPKNAKQKVLAEVLRKAIDIDPDAAPAMLKTLTFDNNAEEFDDIEKCIQFRIPNSGYWMFSFFICWDMGFVLTGEEYESIKEWDTIMGAVLGLTNDYFSWNVKKDRQANRVHNGVFVLMKQHGIGAKAATTLLLGIIVELESQSAKLREERRKQQVSEEVWRYIEVLEFYVGASCYWHATAP